MAIKPEIGYLYFLEDYTAVKVFDGKEFVCTQTDQRIHEGAAIYSKLCHIKDHIGVIWKKEERFGHLIPKQVVEVCPCNGWCKGVNDNEPTGGCMKFPSPGRWLSEEAIKTALRDSIQNMKYTMDEVEEDLFERGFEFAINWVKTEINKSPQSKQVGLRQAIEECLEMLNNRLNYGDSGFIEPWRIEEILERALDEHHDAPDLTELQWIKGLADLIIEKMEYLDTPEDHAKLAFDYTFKKHLNPNDALKQTADVQENAQTIGKNPVNVPEVDKIANTISNEMYQKDLKRHLEDISHGIVSQSPDPVDFRLSSADLKALVTAAIIFGKYGANIQVGSITQAHIDEWIAKEVIERQNKKALESFGDSPFTSKLP